MRQFLLLIAVLILSACEKPVMDEDNDGNSSILLTFVPTVKDVTRANPANYISKINIQLFDINGQKVFEKVKTQNSDDSDFCSLSLTLNAGTYTVVAVGHSSRISATIKSPEAVQFTASEGEKLTDTFCHCSTVTVKAGDKFTLPMYRATAMIQFVLTDKDLPANFAYFIMDYTGGSANFNPTTLQGITKSTQSERRIRNSLNTHQAYTFPYMANSCNVKMTVKATDREGTIIHQRVFDAVPVTRNRITTYTGHFFEKGDGEFTVSDFGFVIHADWDGENFYNF